MRRRFRHIQRCFANTDRSHWIERLNQEYDRINRKYNLGLTRPNIVIRSGSFEWKGLWSPDDRTLTIATELIENFPWPEVVSTLKHEIAHQVANETYRAFSGPEHLKRFQETCELLEVPENAHDHDDDPIMQAVPQEQHEVLSAPEIIFVRDKKGKETKMKYLGTEKGEYVITPLTYAKTKSELITGYKRFEIVRKALLAAGIAKFLGKLD